MGRHKARSKGVDVTKRFLQPTSVADFIAVQVAPQQTIQVPEEELSPTQGSEAAFALRREGKLDASMKLCNNWKQGSCHCYAACTFAHVNSYFDIVSNSASASHDQSSAVAADGSSKAAAAAVGTGGGGPQQQRAQVIAPPLSPNIKAAAIHHNSNNNTAASGNAAAAPSSTWLSRLASAQGAGGGGGGSSGGSALASAGGRPPAALSEKKSSGGGGLPLKASWGAPRPPQTDHTTAGSGGFVDLQTAMEAVERSHNGQSNRWQTAATTTTTTTTARPAAAPAAGSETKIVVEQQRPPKPRQALVEPQSQQPQPDPVFAAGPAVGETLLPHADSFGLAAAPPPPPQPSSDGISFCWQADDNTTSSAPLLAGLTDGSHRVEDPLRWLTAHQQQQRPSPGTSPVWAPTKGDLLRQLVGSDDDDDDMDVNVNGIGLLNNFGGAPAAPPCSVSPFAPSSSHPIVSMPWQQQQQRPPLQPSAHIERLMSLLTGDE